MAISLQDFIREFENDDSEVVYSKSKSENLHIIPPDSELEEKPKKIKLNLPKEEPPELEQLFILSETSEAKRELWFKYYNKAHQSKKRNSVVKACREGRFMVTDDDKILVLPKFDMYKKSSSEALKEKWL